MNPLTEKFTFWFTACTCIMAYTWDIPVFYNLAIGATLAAFFICTLKIFGFYKTLKHPLEENVNPWNPFPTVWIDADRDFQNIEVIIQSDPYRIHRAKVSSKYRMGDQDVIMFSLTDKCFMYEKGVGVDRQFDQIIAWRHPS